MSKHRGDMRDAIALGPEPAVALILEPADLPLIERLLMHYANEAFLPGPQAHRWQGFSMAPWEARRLAQRVRNLYRGRANGR